jgi:hypothetical protein
MAIANSTQILIDTNKRTVIKRIGIIDSDEQETVIVDPKSLAFALNANNLPFYSGNTVAPGFANSAFTVSRVLASVDSEVGHLQLKWQGNNLGSDSKTMYAFGVGNIDTNPQYQLPAIINNATFPTGNITLKSVGTTANAAYTVIIELHKDSRFYSAGQFQDPGAFNYSPYDIKP